MGFLAEEHMFVQRSVAAGEACVRLRSSREVRQCGVSGRARSQVYDCYAAERRLRQLLRRACFA
ncbi:hypothetical protein EMIT0P253_410031 [Pseudomonas sp. IT-P253]